MADVIPGIKNVRMRWGNWDSRDSIHVSLVMSENEATEIMMHNYESGESMLADRVAEILRGKMSMQLPEEISSESVYDWD